MVPVPYKYRSEGIKRYGKAILETRKYVISSSGGHGKLPEFLRKRCALSEAGTYGKTKYYHSCLGRHRMYKSTDGFHFRPAGALLLSPD